MLLRSSFWLLRSNFSFPRGRVMIFILVFGITMQTFAWTIMGSLREGLFGLIRIYYATTTQNAFFGQKKADFYRCHARPFWLRKPFFYDFWTFGFSVVLHGLKIGLFDGPKNIQTPCKSDVFYKFPNSSLRRAWSIIVFWRFFHFFNHTFTWHLLP